MYIALTQSPVMASLARRATGIASLHAKAASAERARLSDHRASEKGEMPPRDDLSSKNDRI